MSKSAIYVANTHDQDILAGGLINLGTVLRRFGPNLQLSGNSIQLSGSGYYDIDLSATITASAAGVVGIEVYRDGVLIPGAVAQESAAAADDIINLNITSLVREFCPCSESISNLTFILTTTDATVNNISIVVEKL